MLQNNLDGLYDCLKKMVHYTEQRQSSAEKISFSSPKSWLNEMCTIQFGLPRQSGHSTFGMRLFREHFKSAIYLFPYESIAKYHREKFRASTDERLRIKSVSELRHFYGIKIDAIIVDCSSFLSGKDKERIEDLAARNVVNDNSFILLYLE